MLDLAFASQYKKDIRRIKKDNKFKESELELVINTLRTGKKLDPKYLDHPLSGDWKGYRDCHVQNDVVLIYKITTNTLYLARVGIHSNLFG